MATCIKSLKQVNAINQQDPTLIPSLKTSDQTHKTIIGNYIIEKTIGEGTFGKVKLGIHIGTEEQVAIKILEKDKIQDSEDWERITREISILKKLNHPNIIKIYDIIENSKNYYIIMEYASCGELFTHIVKNKRLQEEAAYIYLQIIYGLQEIHKYNIVHRDIKPENLLLKENNLWRIIDFGLSNNYNDGEYLSTPCGSPCYAAPEMILGKKYSGLLVDLWSSGIVLYAMVLGYLPFEDKNNEKLYKRILNGYFELPDKLSENCKDLLRKILTVNPNKRINIEGILSHPFLNRAKSQYKIDEISKYNNTNYCEPVIDKMVNNINGNNFKREEIIFNISNNKHNNITATYYIWLKKFQKNPKVFSSCSSSQQTLSLNTTSSPIKIEEKQTVQLIKNNAILNTITNINKNQVISQNKGHNPHSRIISENNLIDNCSTRGYSVTNRDKYSKTNRYTKLNSNKANDISVNLDISNVIKSNQIDSNIIIGVPKWVTTSKINYPKIFRRNIHNNNMIQNNHSQSNTSTEKYSKKYSNKINTSISYDTNSNETSIEKNKAKICVSNKGNKKAYIPSNTINWMEDNSSTNKNYFYKNKNIHSNKEIKPVSVYSSNSRVNQTPNNKNKNCNNSNTSINISSSSINIKKTYKRSQSVSEENQIGVRKRNYFQNNSMKEFWWTFIKVKESNLNTKQSKPKDTKETEENTSKNNVSVWSTSKSKNYNSSRKSAHCNKKYTISNNKDIKKLYKEINSNSNYSKRIKITMPSNGNQNTYNKHLENTATKAISNYCPSFTENMSSNQISIDKYVNNGAAAHSNSAYNSNKKTTDITISIKTDKSVYRHSKNRTNIIRPISPMNWYTKVIGSENIKNKIQHSKANYNIKPNVIDIDITSKTKVSQGESTKNRVKPKTNSKWTTASNSLKNIIKNNSNSKSKKAHYQKHDMVIVDLSKDDIKGAKSKKPSNRQATPEIAFNLNDDIDTKRKWISSNKDFAWCTTNSSKQEIHDKWLVLCKENNFTWTEVDKGKYICKKDSDNTINIEISSVGSNNVLKWYHLNGQETITKDMIKKIIITIGF